MSFRAGDFLFRFRGIIPVLVLTLGIIADYFGLGEISTVLPIKFDYWMCGCLMLAMMGELVRIYTVGLSPKGTSGRNKDQQVAEQLNTLGLYSMTRNPLYFGNFLIWLSVVLLFQNIYMLIFFLAFFSWFYSKIMQAEARFLMKEYGHHYKTWSENTPAFFPALSIYKPSTRSFNWYKVIRKEKNGIAAILMIFPVIRFIRLYFDDQLRFDSGADQLWLTMGCFGLLYYLVIKLMMIYTNWLNNPPNREFDL